MMSLDNIRIVLVSPLYGGNVGSVCRAMMNMGLSQLVIAAPRTLDMKEANMMACHSASILEGRKEYPTLAEAVADCGRIVGTSAREGLYRQQAVQPRDIAHALLKTAEHGPVAMVFGREDKGLLNEEIALCTDIIQIPTGTQFTSLNLSQAVMVCAYELFLATASYEPPVENSPDAPSVLRERMFASWRETLLGIGFMSQEKADHMMLGLRRVLSRGKLTVNDAKIMTGIARQTAWASGLTANRPTPERGEKPNLSEVETIVDQWESAK